MDKKKLAREIIENVGGIKNIKDINHCVTRLRFNLLSDEKANTEKIENLDGVIGVMIKAGQYQIIIGSEVMDLYSEIMTIMPKMEKTTVVHSKKKIKNYFLDILNTLSSCINGVIPVIVGSGMIKILLIVLKQTGVSESPTYRLLEIIGDAAFYFLPILLAYIASKKFKTDPVLAIVVSSILIHPTLIEWMADTTNITFLGVPVYSATYTSSVIPPILATWILSLIIPVVNKATPGWTKSFLQPAIVLLITVPIVLIVFAPLGAIIGVGLSTVSLAAHSFSPWITMMILSAIMPFTSVA